MKRDLSCILPANYYTTKMKYLVVLSCLAVVVYGLPPEIVEKIKEKILNYDGECRGEIGAGDDDIAPIKAHQPPTTQKGKCFMACMYKKFGFQDASGKIDKAATYALVEKMKPLDAELYGKMMKVTDTCTTEVTDAADECETAFNMYICMCREKTAAGIPPIDL